MFNLLGQGPTQQFRDVKAEAPRGVKVATAPTRGCLEDGLRFDRKDMAAMKGPS